LLGFRDRGQFALPVRPHQPAVLLKVSAVDEHPIRGNRVVPESHTPYISDMLRNRNGFSFELHANRIHPLCEEGILAEEQERTGAKHAVVSSLHQVQALAWTRLRVYRPDGNSAATSIGNSHVVEEVPAIGQEGRPV